MRFLDVFLVAAPMLIAAQAMLPIDWSRIIRKGATNVEYYQTEVIVGAMDFLLPLVGFLVIRIAKKWGAVASPFETQLQVLGLVESNPRYAPDTDCWCERIKQFGSRGCARLRRLWR